MLQNSPIPSFGHHFSQIPLVLRLPLNAPSFGRHFSAMPLIVRRFSERRAFGPHSQQCLSFCDAPLSDPSFLTNVPHYFFVNGEWGVRYLLVTGTSPHSLVVRETMTLSPNSDCSSNSDNAPHLQLPLNVPSFGPYFSPIPLILRRPRLPLIRFPLLTSLSNQE